MITFSNFRSIHLLLILGLSISVSGCGGGDSSSSTTEKSYPEISVSKFSSTIPRILFQAVDESYVSISSNNTLSIVARITATSGVDPTQNPPTITVINTANPDYLVLGPLPMKQTTGAAGFWSYDLTYRSTPKGTGGSLKTVIVTAYDTQGNRTSAPIGTFYLVDTP